MSKAFFDDLNPLGLFSANTKTTVAREGDKMAAFAVSRR